MRLYRALLLLYPASFRHEYGEEMRAVFARRRRDSSSFFAVVALWIETLLDIITNAFAVHADILRQDVRYALRTLARTPGFTMTAIVVAALGIGATTAAFTMIDHVRIHPFPFADQDRLVRISEDHGARGSDWDMSPANYRDWKQMNRSFETMAAFHAISVNMIGQGEPQRIDGATVNAEMFPMLGVAPLMGRHFEPADDRDGAPGTLLIGYSLWQNLFGGDPAALGRKVILDDAPYTIVGVMPENFYFPSREAQLWTVMRFQPQDFEHRSNCYIYAIGKLKPGVTLAQARADMRLVTGRLARAYPNDLAHTGATMYLLRDALSPQSLLMLKVLLGAALCVLLISCTNLANLLLARAMTRRRELAVRAALGAGRERIVRQMLTESLLLALAGGVLGIAIARSALPLLARLVPVSLPIAEVPSIDLRVLAFALLATCATGLAFGVVPALRLSRRDDADGLREGSRAGVGGRRERLRSGLVVAEVAGSIVLLVSCGLLIRALWRIQAVDPGFRTDHILTLRTALPEPRYDDRARREAFYRRVLDPARQLPGVTGAAYISFLPMRMRGGLWPVEIQGRPQPLSDRESASLRFVTPGFFSVLGIPLLSGRDVSESDSFDRPFVAVVSASFVRRYFGGDNPLGRHFDFGVHDRTIVGVVGDVRVRGLERASEPQVYLSYKQENKESDWYAPKDLVVRTKGDPTSVAPALRRIIREADPEQPVSDVQPLSEIVGKETTSRSVQAIVLGCFALIAFLLAAIGIHGLLSFAVANRTQEIGVRMALGARSADILGMTLRDGFVLAGIGTIVGAALAYAAGRALQSLLAGIQPGDLATFAAAIAAAVVMTIAGSLLPAMRAIRVDPVTAIRAE